MAWLDPIERVRFAMAETPQPWTSDDLDKALALLDAPPQSVGTEVPEPEQYAPIESHSEADPTMDPARDGGWVTIEDYRAATAPPAGLRSEAERLSCEIRTAHIADRLFDLLDTEHSATDTSSKLNAPSVADQFLDTEHSSEPFAEIDAEEFEKARRDPVVQRFAEAADAHLAQLRAEGRIDLGPSEQPSKDSLLTKEADDALLDALLVILLGWESGPLDELVDELGREHGGQEVDERIQSRVEDLFGRKLVGNRRDITDEVENFPTGAGIQFVRDRLRAAFGDTQSENPTDEGGTER